METRLGGTNELMNTCALRAHWWDQLLAKDWERVKRKKGSHSSGKRQFLGLSPVLGAILMSCNRTKLRIELFFGLTLLLFRLSAGFVFLKVAG